MTSRVRQNNIESKNQKWIFIDCHAKINLLPQLRGRQDEAI
ncbi:hypothetical protein [Helicobacter fennelliae]|uniref:Uncharacterized protein n=1 Tax=Helicobacter fennelliae MRY12-0050 TaxID=1325130 RepID=T1DV43_9HELI|nr:hypothetical protein [Helicobacter fennelliae]GAD18237.1 hypothetical protein HFN_1835 [Helicobacter fennelliae MRY12-0050]